NSHVFSPSLTNETRIAYNRIDLRLPLRNPNGLGGTVPRININGDQITALGTPPNFPQGRIANNYLMQPTPSFLKRNLIVRGGLDFLRPISTQAAPYAARGGVTFNASNGFTAFSIFIDNFGGSGGSANRDFGSAVYFPTLFRTAAFFQDRWRF